MANLFPFIKPGGLSGSIREPDLVRAAREYALPQVEIVEPSLVVCLGKRTFNAIRVACTLPKASTMAAAVESSFSLGCSRIWAQAHTGSLGQNNRNRGGVNRVEPDWASMKREFERESERAVEVAAS
jgi:restriction system protein